MKVLRAHSYAPIEAMRAHLSWVPAAWRSAIADVPWIVLPADVSPRYVGLLRVPAMTAWGLDYDDAGGWCAAPRRGERVAGDWGGFPYIYLRADCAGLAVHEAGHALASAWHAPLAELYRPERALYPYMAHDPDEYFACAVDAFVRDDCLAPWWNRAHLAASDPDMHEYLIARERDGEEPVHAPRSL